jgi:putative nucleotidyltransferase with HDIG domain
MNLISFKNLKLFKSSAPPRTPLSPNGETESAPARLRESPFLYIFLTALVLAYFVSYVPSRSLPEFKSGDIATSDVIVPADLTIEDAETTETRRQAAVEAVLPVYVFDPNVFLNIEDKVRQFFLAGRQWLKTAAPAKDYAQIQKTITDKFGIDLTPNDIAALEKAEFGADLESLLLELMEKHSRQGIILSKSLFINREPELGFTFLRGGKDGERTVRSSEILEIKEVKEKFVVEINALDLPPRKKGLLISLAYGFVAPNVTFNKVETEARRDRARAAVASAFFSVKNGKVIARKGDEVTPDAAKVIRAINQSVRRTGAWLSAFLGSFLLFALLLLTIWFYLKSLGTARVALKHFLMIGLTLAISLLLTKALIFVADTLSPSARFFLFSDAESYKFAFPYQFGVILFAFLTTNTVGLIYAILNSLLIGYLFDASYFLMIFSLIGGLAAIYGIKIYQRQKRTATLRAGFFLVAPLNLFVVLTFTLIKPHGAAAGTLAAGFFMGVIGGLLSAALAFVLLPIYENIFRFVTQSKLLELTNSESEIFRQMAIEAPGSYHHALIVASLAEKAAEAIGADALLVKAGALYHDIGKIKMPEYFIENKIRKADAHKALTPSMSTLVIINHVKEGVEIARKEKLPVQIREIIEQHHGNSLVRYFYLKAKEKSDPDMGTIGEETYRYPGPRPQTKEAALVMLADSAEAASKSLKFPKEDNLKRVIRDIFDNYLQDGQLDDCSFSLKELRTVAASFLATLLTVYQPRVDYPGFQFDDRPRKKAERPPKKDDNDDHDRNHQPPEES